MTSGIYARIDSDKFRNVDVIRLFSSLRIRDLERSICTRSGHFARTFSFF